MEQEATFTIPIKIAVKYIPTEEIILILKKEVVKVKDKTYPLLSAFFDDCLNFQPQSSKDYQKNLSGMLQMIINDKKRLLEQEEEIKRLHYILAEKDVENKQLSSFCESLQEESTILQEEIASYFVTGFPA